MKENSSMDRCMAKALKYGMMGPSMKENGIITNDMAMGL